MIGGVSFWADSPPKPERFQRQRRRGWRKPPNTINVTRPGKHGNPYYPGCGIGYGYFDENMGMVSYNDNDPAQCVLMFRIRMRNMKQHQPEDYERLVAPLRGKNVMCWCKSTEPCHGDVWLELACEAA